MTFLMTFRTENQSEINKQKGIMAVVLAIILFSMMQVTGPQNTH